MRYERHMKRMIYCLGLSTRGWSTTSLGVSTEVGSFNLSLLLKFSMIFAVGLHIIDVTNASRSLLLDLRTLQWSEPMLKFFGFRSSILPKIVSNSEIYGTIVKGKSLLYFMQGRKRLTISYRQAFGGSPHLWYCW
jgi:hypothetical protein